MFNFFKKLNLQSKPKTKIAPVVPEGMIAAPEIVGVSLYTEYPKVSFDFTNDLMNGLEAMMDYSPEASLLAIKRAETMDQSLKRMEFLANGLEKYLNEMVMIAQTPKPSIKETTTPFKRQRTMENLIISQVNTAEPNN
ncbi:hypothetical protein EIN_409870 [Entamoeba invadens IP1]|uniref:Uncharacterized protein n=1 Tax=Entamoeba invadens IP1 TaxID=370355 RepID=A0A0A1U2C4_ENTIV|nr:hypothetical protein EIN_409870 [Entamoeba invadens IP1]ELP85668.1 hypothetical protein EIN_409870 [Entamoeba invadens IP1]|eukprot:XP_004185014.1 hypothetical protein EIN_409870 [Entamoeba invadens IP1]